jgi:26S proteasome regulatory subunit N2
MAVGIACAGTGLAEALTLLQPLQKDRVDFVRQGAFIAAAMVLIQHNEHKEPKVKLLRKAFEDTIASKGDTMTKMGAILGAGILDAGGRNVTMSMLSPAGHKKMAAIVGMALFPQFWFWYPLLHFISLAFTPTAVIGLNKDLKMPKNWTFRSNARPSLFAYPPPVEIKKKEEKKKVKATLSVTAKAQARRLKRQTSQMDIDSEGGEPKDQQPTIQQENTDDKPEDKEDKKDEKKEDEEEPEFELLQNPARVTWAQRGLVAPGPGERYVAMSELLAGIVMLRDLTPDVAEEIVVSTPPKLGVPGISDDEPEPPADFELLR